MLKTLRDNKTWLVSQPDHAEVAGFLAAHWGNDEFARPGHFANTDDPQRLHAETVLAIAQHDNGWWESDATPELSQTDGLPMGLAEVLKNQQEGMNRWRLGIPRFARHHPYVGLLASYHAYWLYAHALHPDAGSEFAHPLFSKGSSTELMGDRLDTARGFESEIQEMQNELTARLRADPACARWVDTDHLRPHVRLLQILDGLSLSLCSALIAPRTGEANGLGDDEFDLVEVPRRNWDDRVTIEVKPAGERRIVCAPYPFDIDPLPVIVPVRVLDRPAEPSERCTFWWHSVAKQTIRFVYCSA